MAEIARRARSSVGSFYARFPTKEALVVALMERYHAEAPAALEAVAGGAADDDLEARARRYVRGVVAACRRRRGLLRLRLLRRLGSGSSGLDDDEARDRLLVGHMRAFFASVEGEIDHPDPARALSFGLRVVDSVVASAILTESTSASFGEVDDAELERELTTMLTGYLRRTPS